MSVSVGEVGIVSIARIVVAAKVVAKLMSEGVVSEGTGLLCYGDGEPTRSKSINVCNLELTS